MKEDLREGEGVEKHNNFLKKTKLFNTLRMLFITTNAKKIKI